MANFKYDIVTLIEIIESKPCIWDKTNENHIIIVFCRLSLSVDVQRSHRYRVGIGIVTVIVSVSCRLM